MISWDQTKVCYHNVRDIDKKAKLFRCFTCDSWFDTGVGQMDRNMCFISTEVQVCPIAQADLFGG